MSARVNGAWNWIKQLTPILIIGIMGLVAAGRIDARMAGAEQRIEMHESELRIYRRTSADLLKKVSRIEGYMRALSERRHNERKEP